MFTAVNKTVLALLFALLLVFMVRAVVSTVAHRVGSVLTQSTAAR